MKKVYMRLAALLLCAVMLVAGIPGKASAAVLEGKKMPQLAEPAPAEVHNVTDFQSLANVAHMAAGRQTHYICLYESGETLVAAENLKIPQNVQVEIKGDLVVPQGIVLQVEGLLSCRGVNVEGTLEIQPGAKGIFQGDVAVSGAMAVYGSITVNGEAEVSRNIVFAEDSHPEVHCRFECEEDLRAIAKQVEDSQEIWKFIAYSDTSEIYFSEPITIPRRLTLKLTADHFVFSGEIITMDGDLDAGDVSGVVVENILILNGSSVFGSWDRASTAEYGAVFESYVTTLGYMTVYEKVVFKSGVRNLHAIDIWCEDGGQVVFEKMPLTRHLLPPA